MNRRFLRPIALGIATLSTVAGMAVTAVSSQAAQIGTFTFSPAAGTDENAPTLSSSAPCDAGTNYQIVLTGAGFPAVGANVTANNPISILPVNADGGYDVPILDTLANIALAQTPPVVYAGDYTFTGVCRNAVGAFRGGTHVGTLTFGDAHHYTSAVAAATTTTALAAAPASPVNTGASVAFTAHVAASAGTPAGTVQLMDGATAVGSPSAIDASGNVTISTAFTTAGSHSVTAAFTGSAGFGSSTSPAVVYTVNQAPSDATVTALSISPAGADTVTPVALTAAVSDVPNAATKPTGSVQFADNGTNLGSAVALVNGVASLSQTYAAGAHSFTAAYTPSNANTFAASASTSQALTVTAFAGVTASENIQTTILAGSLTISVADTSTVVLPSPQLNATATYLTTSGKIHPVTVTDTRAGNPGWTLSGQVSDFANTTGATTTPIVGANLGWTPNVLDSNPSQTIVPGAVVLPATPPVTSNAAAIPAAGLHTARVLASAAAGAGTGTAHVDALLALNVPTTTVAGTYAATLTLTAI